MYICPDGLSMMYIHEIHPQYSELYADEYSNGYRYGIWENDVLAKEPYLYDRLCFTLEEAENFVRDWNYGKTDLSDQ